MHTAVIVFVIGGEKRFKLNDMYVIIMVRSFGFFYNGKYLCPFGLQFEDFFGTGNGKRTFNA